MKAKLRFNLYLLFALSGISVITGCSNQSDKLIACENRTAKLKQENEKLTRELVDCQQQLIAQKSQIENLQKFGHDRLKDMIKLKRISLAKLTGGYDSNHDGYDDSVIIYLQPIDTDGHIVKTAGSVKVQIFSLSDNPQLIGQIELPPNQLRKKWVGSLWTNHYAIKCPFKIAPKNQYVTVRVQFTELLTGRTFIAQKQIKIKIKITN